MRIHTENNLALMHSYHNISSILETNLLFIYGSKNTMLKVIHLSASKSGRQG